MTKSNDERLAVVETKLEVISKQLDEVSRKLDLLPSYATKQELLDLKTTLTRRSWIQNTLSAILGSVLALLVTYFITNIGR